MLKVLVLFLFSLNSYAVPEHIELWFLSIDQTTWLNSIIRKPFLQTTMISQNQRLQCQKMGEYCFDPQVGLYKKDEETVLVNTQAIDMSEVEKNEAYDFIDTPKGVGRELIVCDKNSTFFDIFCGKAKKYKQPRKAKIEVWVDISSTMKQVDFNGFTKQCHRERFLKNLSQTCPLNNGLKVFYFDESRKEAGALDRVCLNSGLNNMKRIVSDMKKSQVKNLIIITDIFEADERFINSIENTGRAIIKGLKKPLYAADMKNQLQRVRKLCK